MQFKRLDTEKDVKFSKKIRLTQSGDIYEVLKMTKWSDGSKIKKLSKFEYLDISTGEIKEFEKTENRSESKRALKRTFEYIRQVINANVTMANRDCCRMVTLTYAENMRDEKRLKKDTEKLIKKLRRQYGHFEYISVVEPQGRGAWHAHMIFIFPQKAPYIAGKTLAEIWGHGSVTVTKILECDNLGAYLTAYLGDISLEEYITTPDANLNQMHLKEVEIDGKPKKYVKGGRLHLYPTGMNIVRTSTGINKPIKEYTTKEEAEKKIGVAAPTFTRTYSLLDEVTGLDITISKSYYNLARKDRQ